MDDTELPCKREINNTRDSFVLLVKNNSEELLGGVKLWQIIKVFPTKVLQFALYGSYHCIFVAYNVLIIVSCTY